MLIFVLPPLLAAAAAAARSSSVEARCNASLALATQSNCPSAFWQELLTDELGAAHMLVSRSTSPREEEL